VSNDGAPPPAPPSGGLDRKGLLWTVLLNASLAVALCWDAVVSFGGKVVGAPDGELYPFLWGQWWVGHSLLTQGRFTTQITLLDFPTGGTLWVKDPITSLLTFPVQLVAGLPAAFTSSMILIFVGSGVGFFLLARLLGASRLVAVVASLTFAFCPHALGEAYNSNLEAMAGGWCALWLWSVLRACRRGGVRPALLAALLLFCLLVTNQYFGLAMALVTGPVLIAGIYESRHTRPWWKQLLTAAGASLVGACLFLPVAMLIRASISHGQALTYFDPAAVLAVPHVSDLKRLIMPLAPLSGPANLYTPFQDLVYPGIITAIMALLAPVLGARGPWRWLWPLAGLSFLVLSLGPALVVDGHVIKWGGEAITLPWGYLITDRPLVGSMTLPHRMAIPTALFLSLGLAWSLDGLRRRFAPVPRVAWALALVFGLGCMVDIIFYPPYMKPLTTTDVKPRAHALLLAAMPGEGAVVNLPFGLGHNTLNTYLYWQTVHRRPVVTSLRVGAAPSVALSVPWLAPLARSNRSAFAPPKPDPAVAKQLLALGYRFVVVHGYYWTTWFGDDDLLNWITTLETTFGKPVALKDHTLIYALRPEDRTALSAKATELLGKEAFYPYPPDKDF